MTLDIEHFQKVTLLREMEDRGEDGYAIVADYMASLTTANREYRLRELKMSGRSPYSSSLYAKYSGDMPAWAFLELTSFGPSSTSCASAPGDGATGASRPPTTTSSA